MIIKCGRTDVNYLLFSPLHSLIAAHAHKNKFCTKIVFCFSFAVNCAKPYAPIKGAKHVFKMHDIGAYRPV